MALEQKQITVITGCVLDGSRVLMSQRFEPELPDADRKWDLPGGKAEFGESTLEVVKREVLEETGIEVQPLELVPYVHTNIWRYEDKLLHVILTCYVCRLAGTTTRIRRQATEARRVEWRHIGSIDLTKVLPGVREFLEWVAREKFGIKEETPRSWRSVYLERVEPQENVDKFYFLSDKLPTVSEQAGQLGLFAGEGHGSTQRLVHAPHVVSRSWGRRGWTPRFTSEEYYSEEAVIRRFEKILRKRQARGYRIVDSTIGNSFDEALKTLEGGLGRPS